MRFLKIVLTSILALIFLLSGCTKENIKSPTTPENNKLEVTITPEIQEYSPLTSSTPGIPLTFKLSNNQSKENLKFHWITEEGTFLKWEKDIVIDLGKDILTNEENIYWSLDPNKKIEKSPFNIYLKIQEGNPLKDITESSIQIEETKEGTFKIR